MYSLALLEVCSMDISHPHPGGHRPTIESDSRSGTSTLVGSKGRKRAITSRGAKCNAKFDMHCVTFVM